MTPKPNKLRRELMEAVPLLEEMIKAKAIHSILMPSPWSPTWSVNLFSRVYPRGIGRMMESKSLPVALRKALKEIRRKR